MGYNTGRILRAEFSLSTQPEEPVSLHYSYNGAAFPFEHSFDLLLPDLHDMLFNELFVILRNEKQKCVGVAKVPLRMFLETEDGARTTETFELRPAEYLDRADCYEREPPKVGELTGSFGIFGKSNPATGIVPYKKPKKDLFAFLFAQKTAHMYRIVYNLLQTTQRGTFTCHMRWIFGHVSAEHYYNYIYGECRIPDCDGASCGQPFCRASYGKLAAADLESAVEMLQYAAAAFANSLFTWGLEKRRDTVNIRDNRKKAILDRLDIEEADLFEDFRGDDSSISYIAFFSKGRLVVSFKGTTSGIETIHDLSCDYAHFQDGYAHRGIRDLGTAFMDQHWGVLRSEMDRRGVKQLVLAGHSLGAAVAVLVYLIMLEREPEWTACASVTAFSCPPVVSASIASKEFPGIKIYNYGHDLVPRLCFGSVLELKYLCISISSLNIFFMDKMVLYKNIEEIMQHLKSTDRYTKLYTPGMLMHIKNFGEDGKSEYMYKAVDYTFFESIICSRKAPFDHLIHKLLSAYKESLKEYGEDVQ
ncbi:hypothetical protein PAPHI01_2311 [Pancytospora philotis]|nr:hypothetical protein PAPHI01_2311 [Pancytospora philotis]